MFKPLSTAYSRELTTYLHNGQGLAGIKKGDFFHLFWKAWVSTFTQVLILRPFETTGIAPLQPPPNTNLLIFGFPSQRPQKYQQSIRLTAATLGVSLASA
jgi:hypothetical protein